MIRRFLQYSLRHQRPIKAVWTEGEEIHSRNVTVVQVDADSFFYLSSRNKKEPKEMQIQDVLSCCYARGDSGDTLKNLEREQKDEG